MRIYRKLDLMSEHKIQLAFKENPEHIAKVNIPNRAYPNQHIDIEILHGSRNDVIVPDTVQITFNFDVESTDKTYCIVLTYFEIFKRYLYPFGLKEDLIERLILCSRDAAATYKISDISLGYGATFKEIYVASISDLLFQ